jgi:hypothetical protein
MRRVVLTLFALTVLALAGVAAAASTDPQISIDPIDQTWAESIVLAPGDFGQGWKAEPMPEVDLEGIDSGSEEWCVEGTPDRSDLIVTGGAVSPDFTRPDDSSVSSYSLVWKTAEQAQTEWDRTLTRMPAFVSCLAALFSSGPKAVKIVVTRKGALALRAVTPRSAAFRIQLALERTVRVKKKRRKKLSPFANFDIVLFGNGRASVTMLFVSFNPKPFSITYERSLVEKMAARMATDPAAQPAP